MMEYVLEIDDNLRPSPVLPALIWAEGIKSPLATESSPGFLAEAILAAQKTGEEYVPSEVRKRVRKMLRYGKYHASGRGKPASEFLLRAALNDQFPLVNGPVDVNNAISLASGLPGSIFDADIARIHLLIRRGVPGETYVFNHSGQTIDLQDLLLVCRKTDAGWEPCGNPVKDAMTTKIYEQTTNIIAVLYAPADDARGNLGHWAESYAELLSSHCKAQTVGYRIIEP
jgi:hypothetical protein